MLFSIENGVVYIHLHIPPTAPFLRIGLISEFYLVSPCFTISKSSTLLMWIWRRPNSYPDVSQPLFSSFLRIQNLQWSPVSILNETNQRSVTKSVIFQCSRHPRGSKMPRKLDVINKTRTRPFFFPDRSSRIPSHTTQTTISKKLPFPCHIVKNPAEYPAMKPKIFCENREL
jgi:hypothetical protein